MERTPFHAFDCLVEQSMINMLISDTVHLAGRDLALYFVGTHWFDLKTVLGGDEAP